MSAYYNEIEPYAAQWLRNLIAKGLIADGEVDTRSIVDVAPDDLRGFTQCHFFAGIGGWSHALRLAEWPDDRPVWTGSCPCQPFSVAGKGAGTDDPRHLWPHFHRLITAVRPPVVMGEQVAGAAGYGWLDGVRADLAQENYASRGVDIPACAVDSPHIRQRLYWIAEDLAYTDMPHGKRSGVSGRVHAQHNHINSRNVHSDMADANHERRNGINALLRENEAGRIKRQDIEASGDGAGDMADTNNAERRQDVPGRHDDNRNQAGWNQNASDVGACDQGHMADTDLSGAPRLGEQCGESQHQKESEGFGELRFGRSGFWSDHVWLAGADGKSRRSKPGLPLLAHGIPNRVGRLRAYGNAIVPPLAAEVIKAFMECEK